MEEIDPLDTDRITLKMYAWAFSQLGSLDERALQKTHRVRLATFSYALWNIVGMIIFHYSEGWSFIECVPAALCCGSAFTVSAAEPSAESDACAAGASISASKRC